MVMVSEHRNPRQIVLLTRLVAIGIALLISLIPPGAYFWASHGRLAAETRADSRRLADEINLLISHSPADWQDDPDLLKLLQAPPEQPARQYLLRRSDGRVLHSSGDAVPSLPVVRQTAFGSGDESLLLEVRTSYREEFDKLIFIALTSLWFGVWSYLLIKILPLRALNNALDALAAAQARAFHAQREKAVAEKTAEMRTRFLATMSHELRTPMNGVLGMLDLVRDTPLDKEQQEYIDIARLSARNLLVILNDVLDFAKIDQGKLSLAPLRFDPDSLLRGQLDAFRLAARQKGLVLDYQPGPDLPSEIESDPDRLRQIVANLLGNAIKFTAQGRVELHLHTCNTDEHGPALEIAVRDTGIGIPADRLRHIFEPFAQADDSTTRNFGGTGLGLSIARQLSELLGGQLTVSSEPGAGSCFTLRLPLPALAADTRQAAGASNEAPAAPAPDLPPIHVLVVEDNPINQRVVSTLLGKRGHRVSLAENGASALATPLHDVDLILMDMEMPVMGGLEATRRLRERGETLPIIALTAHVLDDFRTQCLAAGMDEVVAKPIVSATLFAAITDALHPAR